MILPPSIGGLNHDVTMPYGVLGNCSRGTGVRCRGSISWNRARRRRDGLVVNIGESAVCALADTSLLGWHDARTTAPSGGGRISGHAFCPRRILRHDLESE